MSGFWSAWVTFFVVLNWCLVVFLVIYAIRVRIPTAEDGTTGHVWAHGAIREGVRRLPGWWVAMSVVFIAFAVLYLVLYPGLGSYAGTLGWTSAAQVESAIERNEQRRASLQSHVSNQSIDALAGNPEVMRIGRVLYEDSCAACHGPSGEGNQAIGAPDLTDDTWLYGGDDATILTSIAEGRAGVMPAFGGNLGEREIRGVAAYVYELNGRDWPHDRLVAAGKRRYESLCIACHGADGTGNKQLGAPDLTDHEWLYGGSLEALITTIANGRQGHMPSWSARLGEDEMRILTAWIRAAGAGSQAQANGTSE